jgi:hypothetical protein
MDDRLKRAIVAIVRPPVVASMFVLGKTYSTFFGWYDRRLAKRAKQEFALQVRQNLSFLFTEYGAQIITNDCEPPSILDLAKVTISTEDLRFVLTRDRGAVHGAVAAAHSPNDWQDLSALLKVIEGHETEYSRLPTIARLIEPRMSRLKRALSEAEYGKTKASLADIYDERFRATRRAEAALNRRLYGP